MHTSCTPLRPIFLARSTEVSIWWYQYNKNRPYFATRISSAYIVLCWYIGLCNRNDDLPCPVLLLYDLSLLTFCDKFINNKLLQHHIKGKYCARYNRTTKYTLTLIISKSNKVAIWYIFKTMLSPDMQIRFRYTFSEG